MDHHEHGTEEHSAPFIKSTKNLSLDKYCTFLASGDCTGFTLRHLNTVLSIHGIKQMNGRKELLVEAVSAMELKDFSRCTLGESIQPTPMSMASVVKDLTQLSWQACPVVSVRSISSAQYNTTAPTRKPKASIDPARLKSEKKSYKKKKKMMMIGPVSKPKSLGKSGRSGSSGGDNSIDLNNSGGEMSGTSGSTSTMPEEGPTSVSKRKRKVNQKSMEYLSSRGMVNLSKGLGMFPLIRN